MLGQPIFLNHVLLIQIFLKQLVEIIKKNYYYFEIDLLEFLFEFPFRNLQNWLAILFSLEIKFLPLKRKSIFQTHLTHRSEYSVNFE